MAEQQTLPKPPPQIDPRRLLTVDDVASQLNVSRYTIWRMRDQGRFPQAIKIGQSSRWQQSDIDAFVAANRRGPGDNGVAKRRKPGPKAAAVSSRP